MAKLTGQILFKGKLGDLVVYKMNGELVVRSKPQVNKSKRKRDPNFIRVRELNAEFGAASKMSKWLRHNWNAIIRQDKDGTLNNRLMSILQKMIKTGQGQRGQRELKWTNHQNLWNNFRINGSENTTKTIEQIEFDTLNGVIEVFNFSLALNSLPQGTTHVQYKMRAYKLPNMVFNSSLGNYKLENINPHSAIWESSVQPIETIVFNPITLQLETGNYCFTVDVGYYQNINGSSFKLAAHPFEVIGIINV